MSAMINLRLLEPGIRIALLDGSTAEVVSNPKDGIWRSVRDEKQKANITVPFEKVKDSKIGELAANFVVVLGKTPAG